MRFPRCCPFSTFGGAGLKKGKEKQWILNYHRVWLGAILTLQKECIFHHSRKMKHFRIATLGPLLKCLIVQTTKEKIRRLELERTQAEDNLNLLSREAAQYKKALEEETNETQLKATMEAYSRMANRDLLSSVSREFSGYVESGLKTILQCALNRPAFFAERLYYSMKGAGTDDSTLVRIVVTRSEIDLVQIKQMFTQMYQKTLSTMIASDTSGDYRKLLLAIVGQ